MNNNYCQCTFPSASPQCLADDNDNSVILIYFCYHYVPRAQTVVIGEEAEKRVRVRGRKSAENCRRHIFRAYVCV